MYNVKCSCCGKEVECNEVLSIELGTDYIELCLTCANKRGIKGHLTKIQKAWANMELANIKYREAVQALQAKLQ